MNAKVTLEQQEDFHFAIRFGDAIPLLHSDEHPPLGKGAGPSPDQLLAAAVGNCLSASLLFALRKFKQAPEPIRTEVEAVTGRNEANRLRILRIAVRLTLGVPAAGLQHLDRVLSQFEQFCTVGESVRQGIPVDVQVYDSTGAKLK
jgi:organic hydroperoxide reductase OsmC/OhrA